MSEIRKNRAAELAQEAERTWGILSEEQREEIEAWSERLDRQKAAAEKTGQVFPAPTLPPHISTALANLPPMPAPATSQEDNPFAVPLVPLEVPTATVDPPAVIEFPAMDGTGPGQDPVKPHRPALVVVAFLERYASAMARILPYLISEYDSDVENGRAINPAYEKALAACRQVAKWDGRGNDDGE
tara:strand:+ start:7560 stop:8117 length:558 start_codon:yes stop_codon:yes gene_type:complete